MVKDLREELHKAKEAAQLQKEAAEAEKQPQYLKSLQQIKPFLLLWKFQQIPTKMLVKVRKLRPPRVRTTTKKRIRARLRILPLLSSNE